MTSTLQELEVKVAFLEDAIANISDEFYLQQKELLELKQQYASLIDKLRNSQGGDEQQVEVLDETPPHY